jgi:cation transport regulator
VHATEVLVPYPTNAQLPPSVRHHLPPHAQDIYRAAFNAAYQSHGPEREELAHRIAWAAVKKKYVQLDGEWLPRDAFTW